MRNFPISGVKTNREQIVKEFTDWFSYFRTNNLKVLGTNATMTKSLIREAFKIKKMVKFGKKSKRGGGGSDPIPNFLNRFKKCLECSETHNKHIKYFFHF